nr:uncharacterized protein LOC109760651 [Aegilops tauschii subsp. strangulata]
MWGRMWGSGRGSGSRSDGGGDHERERRVRSNGVRKRRIGSRGVVGPEDFVADADAVAAAIAECSLREEAERRRHQEELEDLMFQQAVAANLAAKEKDDEWRRIREEQKEKYIDLGSFDKED